MWRQYRQACRDLGVALTETKGFEEGRPYIEKSLETFEASGLTAAPDGEDTAAGCFYLAALMLKYAPEDREGTQQYITRGLGRCPPDSRYRERLLGLQQELSGGRPKLVEGQPREAGVVQF